MDVARHQVYMYPFIKDASSYLQLFQRRFCGPSQEAERSDGDPMGTRSPASCLAFFSIIDSVVARATTIVGACYCSRAEWFMKIKSKYGGERTSTPVEASHFIRFTLRVHAP